MSLRAYFDELEAKVKNYPFTSSVTIRNMFISSDRGYIRLIAKFIDGSELHIFEYVLSNLKRISYSYHYQDAENKIIFRYDNEPHYPQIPSYPHHKHTQDREPPEASSEPDLEIILKEITIKLIKRGS